MGLAYITLTHPELLPREKANIITTSIKDYDTERVQKFNDAIPDVEFARQPNKRKQVFKAVNRLIRATQHGEEDHKIDLIDDLTANFRQSVSSDVRRIFHNLGLKNQDSISEEQSD
jgi:hypothetical protein